jgi:hypothetical protein
MGFALRRRRFSSWLFIFIGIWLLALVGAAGRGAATATALQSGTFVRKVLAPALPESPFDLRFFSDAVKTNSRGEIITGLYTSRTSHLSAGDVEALSLYLTSLQK